MREALRWQLSRYEPATITEPLAVTGARGYREAGVLALIYENDGHPFLIFQKRTETVQAHRGQISFPGGRRDPEDVDLRHTALRETWEEIGVEPKHIDVLGSLDEIITGTRYRVTPFVGWLESYPYEWVFSDAEVARLLEVPVAHLLDPANYVPDRRPWNGRMHEFPAYDFEGDLIWGATARMLSNLLDIWRLAEAIEPAELRERS
jgi:8-oxo-dGTP pyrophosphatase MutT (NUDIX family)